MSRKSSITNLGGIDGIVNGLATIVVISLVCVGYLSALGNFAGIA